MTNNKREENIICKICGTEMEQYDYAYDNNQYGKVYYKCNECGNKINFII